MKRFALFTLAVIGAWVLALGCLIGLTSLFNRALCAFGG